MIVVERSRAEVGCDYATGVSRFRVTANRGRHRGPSRPLWQSRSKNQFIPLFLDRLGQSEKGCKVISNLLPCFLRSEHGVRAFSISLFSSSLSIGLSLPSPLLFSGDPSTSGSSEIGGYETSSGGLSFQQQQFVLPLSLFFLFFLPSLFVLCFFRLLSLLYLLFLPFYLHIFSLLFSIFP